MDTEVVVVGAGVIGLACAQALAAAGHAVIVLERHERFGVEISSRNSEVVHAGIHYPAGSLKATLCARGNASLYTWCAEHNVPHRKLGKLIVATTADEERKLDEILARAAANGVTSVRPLEAAEARRLEPHLKATGALWSPDSGIVDSHALMASLLADAEAHGTAVAWRHRLAGVDRAADDGYCLHVEGPDGERVTFTARWVVNAAGLESDRIAALPGLDADGCGYRLHYARGHYFRVHPRRAALARHLIYPTPLQTGLGIHVTIDLAGELRLGPDVQYLAERVQDYDVAISLREVFWEAVSRYLDGLEPEDLTPDLAGIRPKLQGPGEAFRDFVIAEESARGLPRWVNLVGIESPGLTCALEIGRTVRRLLEADA